MSRSSHTQLALTFRSELKAIRRERKMTQESLAARLGMPQSYVSKVESGERRIDFIETLELCSALGITVGDLEERMGITAKGQKITMKKGNVQ